MRSAKGLFINYLRQRGEGQGFALVLCHKLLFEVTPFHSFADDSQVMEIGNNVNKVIMNMERKIELTTKWLRNLRSRQIENVNFEPN